MPLTPAQKQTLKADVLANPDALAIYLVGDLTALASLYNAGAPPFTVWKSNVPLVQIGDNIIATDLAGLTALNVSRLQAIADYSALGVNPSLADRRAFFDDIFSVASAAGTRAKLLTLWKRIATRAEKLFANTSAGNGTDATPATLVFEGAITPSELVGL